MITKALFTRAGRPGKLRTQVLIGVLVITLGALAVFDVAAVTALRTYLLTQTDGTLKSALSSTRPQLPELLPDYRKQESALTLPVYGAYYIAFVPARGAVVNLQGGPGLKPVVSAVAKAGVVQAAMGARAKAYNKVVTAYVGIPQYRLWSVAVPALSGTLVAGTNLKNVDATVDRLRLIVASGSAAVAVLIFLGVGLVMRQGLRPIEAMASQADRITAGDLTDRVEEADAGSEVGRLGAALNGMLARIEVSVAEREASQDLMRRFLAEASHELRTPLASLRANAELYQQGALTERPQVDEAMRRIMLEAQRMGRLVDDMLRLARLDQHPARQRDPVDVSALVAGCVERTRIADPDRSWQAWIAPGLVAVGDEELLGRAIDNLLANVQTHTPAGTTAVITATAGGGMTGDGHVVVEVSDNGPGVPADRLPRIFDRFYRAGTPANRPGSGLGLAIVTEIAAAHDGTVTAAPGWPSGLRVTLAVPAPKGRRKS
jgi:two-component system OmpR family sensor kinase